MLTMQQNNFFNKFYLHASKIAQQAATASQHWPKATQHSPIPLQHSSHFLFFSRIITHTIINIKTPTRINTITQIGVLLSLFLLLLLLLLLGLIIISIYAVYSFNKWMPKNKDLFSFLISINVISLTSSEYIIRLKSFWPLPFIFLNSSSVTSWEKKAKSIVKLESFFGDVILIYNFSSPLLIWTLKKKEVFAWTKIFSLFFSYSKFIISLVDLILLDKA